MTFLTTNLKVAELWPAAESAAAPGGAAAAQACFHCGTPCSDDRFRHEKKHFCCQGCLTVFELLTENGLDDFYTVNSAAGVRVNTAAGAEHYRYLDEPSMRARLIDFSNDRLTRITFHLPAIHCLACIWLLEKLFLLRPEIGESQVNFPRKEAAIAFRTADIRLSEVVALLVSLGYEPDLKLASLESRAPSRSSRRLWIQLGLAGFAFGNIMLFSISAYLGLDAFTAPGFRRLFGVASFLLTLPVITYSAADYWRAAWTSLQRRVLDIDVPIAAGIAAIFAQSTWLVFAGHGDGYFDSLNGLIFFLLCGRLFQQVTYERLAFDRDYKSFFPLAVTRLGGTGEEHIALSDLRVGDRLAVRHGELIPADAKLLSDSALVDYSFVTGESEPARKFQGELLYAGGRQTEGQIAVETVKAVSQSYLTSLWDQAAFRKDRAAAWKTLTNQYSQRFTKMIIAIAVGAAIFWAVVKPSIALTAFTSVLIVACPCALALAAPFALGSAQRLLARRGIFLKNTQVLEALARVDSVVFDKTGTLTSAGAGSVAWQGPELSESGKRHTRALAAQSQHPLAARIARSLAASQGPATVQSFKETAGKGIQGRVNGWNLLLGSAAWLRSRGIDSISDTPPGTPGSAVHLAIEGVYRGHFVVGNILRPEVTTLVSQLSGKVELALLSGDNDRERNGFSALMGPAAELRFQQSPFDKLDFIASRQQAGRSVMMVGDGLNDAGALRQSNVGVAVVENVTAFSPASDVIVTAAMVPALGAVLHYARQSGRVVSAAFLISAIYNVIGVAIAASGRLSPLVCAVLMPLSSVTVVAFACAATRWFGRNLKHWETQP